jgi:sigma54-dependent transcription regulator
MITICHDDRPVIPIMYLYRLILDNIDFIGSCEKQLLLEELKQVATGVSVSKAIQNKELQLRIYRSIEDKIAKVHKLINQNRLNSN